MKWAANVPNALLGGGFDADLGLCCELLALAFGFLALAGVPSPCLPVHFWGHEATDTGLAYAPVSQAHGRHHSVHCFALLHCSTDQFCTTPGGL